jgi:CheY-like chemotaxis protein
VPAHTPGARASLDRVAVNVADIGADRSIGFAVPYGPLGTVRGHGPSQRTPSLQRNVHVVVTTSPVSPVLIVEDDADLRDMMAKLLELEGFDATAVSNGLEALTYLHRHPTPKLILLDLMMPVMDGWEFRRKQRQDPAIAAVPVVVLSALDRERATELIADDFLKKPLDFDHLLTLVREYCQAP